MKIKDGIIGLIGIIIMFAFYAPIFAFIENLTSKLSNFDNHVLTILFYMVLFVGGYWYFRMFRPEKTSSDSEVNGNDNIKRDFHDYM